jgi:GNAT superfamily N-acetyltransferase
VDLPLPSEATRAERSPELAATAAAADSTVRGATEADLAALASLRYDFRAELGAATEARADFAARCRRWMAGRIAGPSWRCWVVEERTSSEPVRLLGTVWVQLFEKMPNPIGEAEAHAYVTNLYVVPAARGRGLGSRLLEAALGWCGEREVDAVLLWPSERSRALYERHGFAVRDDVLELRRGRQVRESRAHEQ